MNDKAIDKEVKRIEKARIERKINELQKKKGINNLKELKNLDALLIDEELPSWNFSIERRFFNDTIEMETQMKTEFKNNMTFTKEDFNRTVRHNKTNRLSREPLLKIEVNLDENNRVQKLEIYSNDDPSRVAENFAKKYGKNIFI